VTGVSNVCPAADLLLKHGVHPYSYRSIWGGELCAQPLCTLVLVGRSVSHHAEHEGKLREIDVRHVRYELDITERHSSDTGDDGADACSSLGNSFR